MEPAATAIWPFSVLRSCTEENTLRNWIGLERPYNTRSSKASNEHMNRIGLFMAVTWLITYTCSIEGSEKYVSFTWFIHVKELQSTSSLKEVTMVFSNSTLTPVYRHMQLCWRLWKLGFLHLIHTCHRVTKYFTSWGGYYGMFQPTCHNLSHLFD